MGFPESMRPMKPSFKWKAIVLNSVLRLEVADSDWLNGIEFNFGYGDYKHSESGFEMPVTVSMPHICEKDMKEGLALIMK